MESREIFKRKIVLNWINQFLPEQLGEEKQYTIKDFESGNQQTLKKKFRNYFM